MLICLILIPVAALCGSSFPAVVKAIQNGQWPKLADFRGPAGPPLSQATEAPRFVPPPATSAPQAADPRTLGFPGPAARFGPAPQDETKRSPVVAANYTAPVNTPPSSDAGTSAGFSQDKDLGIGPTRRLSPVSPGMDNLLPLDHPVATAHADAAAQRSGSAGNSSPSDQFNYVQVRLRQLGATYYLLETCGDEKREFRFYCKMSIGGNPRFTQPFWSCDGDPLKAMTQVLKQVEDWRSSGG
jgi:hypothetical protein